MWIQTKILQNFNFGIERLHLLLRQRKKKLFNEIIIVKNLKDTLN